MKQTSYILFFISIVGSLGFSSCKKETTTIKETIVDNYIYEVGGTEIYQSNIEKTKQKSTLQYVSILYANLYQTAIAQEQLAQLGELRTAIGDKSVADDLILSGFVNNPNVIIPSNADMRADVDQFVEEVYLRFFLRKPTAYEAYFLKNEIEEDANLTPQLIYTSFALSNEYQYY